MKASLVLSAGHFISTLAVVLLFYLAASVLGLLTDPLFIIGGVLLIGVGIFPYVRVAYLRRKRITRGGVPTGKQPHVDHVPDQHDHPGSHDHPPAQSAAGVKGHAHGHSRELEVGVTSRMSTIFMSALVLGFIHEEEFALIGFIAAGADALLVGLLYGLCVTTAIVGATMLTIRLARSGKGGMNARRAALLGHSASLMMVAIGTYYIGRGLGLV